VLLTTHAENVQRNQKPFYIKLVHARALTEGDYSIVTVRQELDIKCGLSEGKPTPY
jgi:hypothetical protein